MEQNPGTPNLEEQFFDDVIEKILTESMFPFLIRTGIVNPFMLTVSVVKTVRAKIEKDGVQNLDAAEMVTSLEADCYSQLLGASQAMFSDEERKNMKTMIRASRLRAVAELEKYQQANKANLN